MPNKLLHGVRLELVDDTRLSVVVDICDKLLIDFHPCSGFDSIEMDLDSLCLLHFFAIGNGLPRKAELQRAAREKQHMKHRPQHPSCQKEPLPCRTGSKSRTEPAQASSLSHIRQLLG